MLFLLINAGLSAQVKKVGHSRQAGSDYKSSPKISAGPSTTRNKTANTNVREPGDGGGGGGGGGVECTNSPAITISSGTGIVCIGAIVPLSGNRYLDRIIAMALPQQ
jgi:hypothetical protein